MYFKIWGSSASDVWAVSEKGVIIHYDGSTWTEQTSGTTQRLITVYGRGPDDVYAVGGVTSSVLLHNDGTGWQQLDMDLGAGLMGVWTAPGQDVFVAGFRGATGLGDGSDWTALPYLTTDCLHATWGDGHGVILAGGGNLLSGSNAKGTIIGTGDIAGGAITDWQP